MNPHQIAIIAMMVVALGWLVAVVIVVADSPLPRECKDETGAQWLRRFAKTYPGWRTWILIYGLYVMSALLLLFTLAQLVR